MKAVARARPLVKGWATAFRLKEGGIVGGGSGGGSAVSQPSLPPAPCSDGAPALVQGTRPEPSVAPGREPTSVARSSRLLLAFTKRTLGGEPKTRPLLPPPESIAELEGKRLALAKCRIHKVIMTYFPTCRRLDGLRSGGALGDFADGDTATVDLELDGGKFAEDGKVAGNSAEASMHLSCTPERIRPPLKGGSATLPVIRKLGRAAVPEVRRGRGPENPAERVADEPMKPDSPSRCGESHGRAGGG